jgi:hypothetical protein
MYYAECVINESAVRPVRVEEQSSPVPISHGSQGPALGNATPPASAVRAQQIGFKADFVLEPPIENRPAFPVWNRRMHSADRRANVRSSLIASSGLLRGQAQNQAN